MKSKWSKVIKSEVSGLAIESFRMAELIPLMPREMALRQAKTEEEGEECEPPHDCSALQEQAFAAGRAAGIEEGKAECRQEVERELQRALTLIDQLEVARTTLFSQVKADLVTLALAIAKKVIHREASLNKDVVIDQVHNILKHLSNPSGVCLKVHPDEIDYLQDQQAKFVTCEGAPLTVRFEGDPAIGLGGCIIQTDRLYIDAAIDQQLELIGEALEPAHDTRLPSSHS